MCACLCVYVCISERREINPMLSPIPGYEFTASVWPLHCLNNNLINPVFISFRELRRQTGRAWGRIGNAGRKYQGGRGRTPTGRTRIREEFNGRDLPCEWKWGHEVLRKERNVGVITSHRMKYVWTKTEKWSWGKPQVSVFSSIIVIYCSIGVLRLWVEYKWPELIYPIKEI